MYMYSNTLRLLHLYVYALTKQLRRYKKEEQSLTAPRRKRLYLIGRFLK